MQRSRAGFSLIEVVIVLALIAIIASIAVPALSTSSDKKSVKGASNAVASQLAVARTAAIARDRCATVHLSSTGLLWVTTQACGGTPLDTLTSRSLVTAFKVTATACSGSSCTPGSSLDYTFDPRGIPYATSAATYVLTRNAAADTIFVGQFGRVTR
ncbi:MAG TPA: GspH/FimT family pseudopilin [Gemmatimonadales bacterium]|nr:GspH/FimT family pseudopilin [Gemmatimonadales bacterium]